ncbi:hypothetical protein GCM10010272_40990 [Streptomyces lateritius]|nr:hypothetical protein GCM10010272_40990 [Streptomyces lateritius]
MKPTWRTLVAAASVTAALVLTAAAPATAADGWQRTGDVSESAYGNGYAKKCARTGYGEACFQGYGEWIWLRDLYANGRPVAMDWYYNGPSGLRSGVAYWDGSATAGWTNLNKSFDEDGDFNFRVCEVDLGAGDVVRDTCSPWTWVST